MPLYKVESVVLAKERDFKKNLPEAKPLIRYRKDNETMRQLNGRLISAYKHTENVIKPIESNVVPLSLRFTIYGVNAWK